MPRSYRSSFRSPLSNHDCYVFFITPLHMSRLPQLSLFNCCHNLPACENISCERAHCVIFPGYLQHSPQSASSFIYRLAVGACTVARCQYSALRLRKRRNLNITSALRKWNCSCDSITDSGCLKC
jgi:hypothetical protein